MRGGGGVRRDTNGGVGVYIAAIYTPTFAGEGKSAPGSGIWDWDRVFGIGIGYSGLGSGSGIWDWDRVFGIGIGYLGSGSGIRDRDQY